MCCLYSLVACLTPFSLFGVLETIARHDVALVAYKIAAKELVAFILPQERRIAHLDVARQSLLISSSRCGIAHRLAPQHHSGRVAFRGENDGFTVIARVAHNLHRLVAREFLTINFNDQVDGRIATASPSIVVKLQPVLFFGVQSGDRLGYRPGTLGEADLVAVRRDAVVVERPADVHATGTGPSIDRAIVWPSSSRRVYLKTWIRHKSRALG